MVNIGCIKQFVVYFVLMVITIDIVVVLRHCNDYHLQDTPLSGYMNIFGGSSPLWLVGKDVSGCGLFAGGCNVFRLISNSKRAYAEYVGSRTIIG